MNMTLLQWMFSYSLRILILNISCVQADTGYITYEPGNMNMILTAPHGGSLTPDHIRSRDAGCWNPANQICVFVHDCQALGLQEDYHYCWAALGKDRNTVTLTRYVSDAVYNMTGKRPYVIINTLHRTKLDANRLRDRAAFDDPIAGAAWEDWHRYINQAKASIGGPAILFDLHAHVHAEGNVELGYLISGQQLDNNQLNPGQSSIRSLASRSNTSFEELIRGQNSLGTMLSAEGYSTVPSVSKPGPAGALYWYGGTTGTNTAVHGSRDGGLVDAIQIETPEGAYLNVPDANITLQYARALARSIVQFHRLYYRTDQGDGSSALRASDFCSQTQYGLRPFFCCLFCSESDSLYKVYCNKEKWRFHGFNQG